MPYAFSVQSHEGEAKKSGSGSLEDDLTDQKAPQCCCFDWGSSSHASQDHPPRLTHYPHFSGGEQTLLAVMLRVAIALFCRERAGFDTSFLILDEVFGDQDGEHCAQLVQFLGEVKQYYHQILVINHVDDVTEMLDSIIDVKRTGLNTSIAELRS